MGKTKEVINVVDTNQLVIELSGIRAMMDENPAKAKQMLTNLTKNVQNKIGKCFKTMTIGGKEG